MITANEIAEFLNRKIYGDKNITIEGPYDLLPGKEFCISFIDSNKNVDLINKTNSDIIIVPNNFDYYKFDRTVILSTSPKKDFFRVINKFFYKINNNNRQGIHLSATISNNVQIGKDVNIGPNVVIEDNVFLDSRSSIAANCYIGKNSRIGKSSIIHPSVTIYHNIEIGNNVIINSGSIIGASGFGVIKDNGKLIQVPHVGNVKIGDNVVLGSGCTVDRATMSETSIGEGTKIDGQVHIAHNVKIGKNCIISGQSAIGGSSILGNNVVLGGQVGIIDHLTIGDNCKVAAKSAVMKSLKSNSIVSGIPAIDHSKKLRLDVLYSKLPELYKKNK